MFRLTNKFKINNFQKLALLSGLFVTSLIMLSSSAFADSQSLAIACRLSGPSGTSSGTIVPTVDSSGAVSCQGSDPGIAYISATGQAAAGATNATIINVNCGNSTVKSYNVGDPVTKIQCKKGTPTVTTTFQEGKGNTGAQICGDVQNQALCPYCSVNNPNLAGCISPNSDTAVTCDKAQCDLVAKYINPVIGLMSVIFGLMAVISLILGGINFATSEGDPQKAGKAKQRIFNTVFAVVAYIFLFAFLEFLVPGGILNK